MSVLPETETAVGLPGDRRAALCWAVFLVACAAALYARTLDYPFLIFDDARFIQKNPLVTSPGSVAWGDLVLTANEGYAVPVTILFQALLYAVGGGSPALLHAASIVLHVAVVLLLFAFARRLSRSVHAAGIAALLFLAHPMNVEPVAWATGAKDLLMTAFALGATLFFVKAIDDAAHIRRAKVRLALAFLLSLLAHLAKPSSVLVGLAWLAFIAVRTGRTGSIRRLAVIVAVLSVVAGVLLGLISHLGYGALGLLSDQPAPFSDLRVFTVLGHQVAHLVWPTSLHPIYRIDESAGFSDPHTLVGVAVAVAGFVAVAAALVRRHATIALSLALAIAFYIPVSNAIPFPRLIADSYLYAPLTGLAALLALGFAHLFRACETIGRRRERRDAPGWQGVGVHKNRGIPGVFRRLLGAPQRSQPGCSVPRSRRTIVSQALSRAGFAQRFRTVAVVVVAMVVAAALVIKTNAQVARWSGDLALWEPVTQAEPDLDVPYGNLATALVVQNRFAEAVVHYEAAYARGYRKDILIDYGVALGSIGRPDDAECVFIEAAYHARQTIVALRNLAILWGSSRAPRYGAVAAALLPVIAGEIKSGRIELTEPLRRGLFAQIERAAPTRELPPWPPGTCALVAKWAPSVR